MERPAVCPTAPRAGFLYHGMRAPGNRRREGGRVDVYSQLTGLGVDPNRLLEFFYTFARFEYALKAARFFRSRARRQRHPMKPEDYPDAEPDWPRFAKSLRNTFRSDTSPELRAACEYLLHNPPHREVVAGDGLVWETRAPSDDLPEVDKVLLSVRWVRNNLFHGAKFSPVHGSPGRNVALIDHSLVVLRACLTLSAHVKDAYDSSALR